MGGSVLKGLAFTRRFERDEFLKITDEISSILTNPINGFKGRVDLVPAYRLKSSFGDCDYLVEIVDNSDIKSKIKELFNPTALIVNDSVYSFDYKELQVDLICRTPNRYETTLSYISFNDIGNLIGRLTKTIFDLKYGNEGLTLPVRIDNTQVLGELIISQCTKEIFELIELDYNKWNSGFDTLEEIFHFVIDYPYFDREIYKLENLNHINKTRQRKRQVYCEFLEYLDNHNIQSTHRDRTEIINKVNNYLLDKGLIVRRDELIKNALDNKAAKAKLMIAMGNFPQLQGKELGAVISRYKANFLDNSAFILHTQNYSIEHIINEIRNIS